MRYEESMQLPGESPLDVLSRAASIVQGQEIEELRRQATRREWPAAVGMLGVGGSGDAAGRPGQRGHQAADLPDRHSPGVDLPTRQRKLERAEVRRLDPLAAQRPRARRCDWPAAGCDNVFGGDEGPLDMSLGRRGSPPPYQPPSSALIGRPAGVTCTAPRRTASGDSTGSGGARSGVTTDFPGVSDPAIDEHFRRSLGNQYNTLFNNPSPSPQPEVTEDATEMSVDDHFAKALGDTWLKLKDNCTEKKVSNGLQLAR